MNPIGKKLVPMLVPLLFTLLSHQTTFAYCDPGAQRWINRDPMTERGFETAHKERLFSIDSGPSLYGFVANNPTSVADPHGLSPWWPPSWPIFQPKPKITPKPPNRWLSGPSCNEWLRDPNVDTCYECCAEQMGLRQMAYARCPAIRTDAERKYCDRLCESSHGMKGPTLR
jgi:hypothetical protein